MGERVKRNKNAHLPWTPDAIASYFRQANDPGAPGEPNPFYWLPKAALLSGMRLNEICSIEVSDIKSAEGITYIDIPKGKTESAVRVVPLHSQLERLLNFAPKKGFLFPSLSPGGPDKKRSWNIGKRLNRRFRLIDGASDFHAFRKNVAEVFERAFVPETGAAQLLGHFKPGLTYGVYSPNGLTLRQRKELIEKLSILMPAEARITARAKPVGPKSTSASAGKKSAAAFTPARNRR
jgi:integrase